MASRALNRLDGNVDLNPDFAFESRGRLVPGGYEVEIRIPFKSLRYQEAAVQDWGIHVLRKVQHTGFQDSWAPAIQADANFLGQSGSLTGLRDDAPRPGAGHDPDRDRAARRRAEDSQRLELRSGPARWAATCAGGSDRTSP